MEIALRGSPALAFVLVLLLVTPSASLAAEPTAPAGAETAFDDDFELDDDWFEDEPPDPLEPSNRVVFDGNEVLYRWVFDPVADAWEWAVPKPVRRALGRFFANLREPSNLVNEVFQLHGARAGTAGARFLLNSTVGLAGLFDPAQRWGFEPHATDFGQTLALYGAGDGAYLVLPVVGPANLRDALGQLVDAAMRPDIWLLASGPQMVLVTSDGLTGYESRRIHLEELRRSSVDFYAALRSAYRMDRAAQVEALRLYEAGGAARPSDGLP